jgi:hypothetical protein
VGLLALAGVDPHGGQAEGRVGGLAASERPRHAARVDGHELPGKALPVPISTPFITIR